ncbi:MAG: hypothetical protein COA88_12710 [Kordia sp.]|nr:MAG: hypothetical protein COA88_12710 [Kordia sp.]
MSNLTISPTPTVIKSAKNTTALHKDLLKIAESDTPYPNPIGEAEPLISFNGYYALNETGSFLTIDTNLLVKNGVAIPHVALIYSKHGTDSNVYHLTGPDQFFESIIWTDTTLIAKSSKGSVIPSFTLTFTREDSTKEITSSVQGTIIEPDLSVIGGPSTTVHINGNNYNNPIPIAMYAGTYYEDKGQGDSILKIGLDNTLAYNYDNLGGNRGTLEAVETFIYNLNMYVFTFGPSSGDITYSIVMGTSATGGMVCNDLVTFKTPKITIPRSIRTVKSREKIPAIGKNSSSENLAKFAGFYRLSFDDNNPNGFLSIEGKYQTKPDDTRDYTVTFGVSLDGTTSKVYTLDSTMSFIQSGENWVLTIPNPYNAAADILKVTFTRKREKAYPGAGSYYGSVVSISGRYDAIGFTGNTLLNVVPLKGYCGAPLKYKASSSSDETMQVISDTEVMYHGHSYKTLTVVPLMYIVGFIDIAGNEVIFSLGTDGGKGITSITTVSPVPSNAEVKHTISSEANPYGIKVYTVIPDGDSAQPKH